MAALTAPRDTVRLGDHSVNELWRIPVAAGAVIHAGAAVVLAGGYAAPATAATGLRSAGRAEHSVDNTGGAAGAKVVEVRRGAFAWVAGEAMTQVNVGSDVYWMDDQTVGLVATGRSRAGLLFQLRGDGTVFVETY